MFSNETVAKSLDERFVCAWVNKRPEARFRDGMYAALNAEVYSTFPVGAGASNITAIFATAGGTVLNAVPGYLDKERFRAEMELALDLHWKMFDDAGQLRPGAVALYNAAHLERAKPSGTEAKSGVLARSGKRAPVAARAHERLAGAGILGLSELKLDYFDDLDPPFR